MVDLCGPVEEVLGRLFNLKWDELHRRKYVERRPCAEYYRVRGLWLRTDLSQSPDYFIVTHATHVRDVQNDGKKA